MKRLPHRKAFALVLVMITIVLAATMAVFFLGSAGRERRGVDLYARGSQVRHLAGMTVGKVMGQINVATKEGTASTPVSWASQPGMVRTYAANGNPSNVYKLYSWDNPVEVGTGFVPTAATQVAL
jgi:FlaG/FlaF family flagellin (archaellin)